MAGNRVYVARSNKCNGELFTRVRLLLEGQGLQVLSYEPDGRPYDVEAESNKIRSCDYFLIIPHYEDTVLTTIGSTRPIGRGCFEQLSKFIEYSRSGDKSYLLGFDDNNKVCVMKKITGAELRGADWERNWACLKLGSTTIRLLSWIEETFTAKQRNVASHAEVVTHFNRDSVSSKFLLLKRR